MQAPAPRYLHFNASTNCTHSALQLLRWLTDAEKLKCGLDVLAGLRQVVADISEAAAAVRAPFAWEDGPLVIAMRAGDMILIDELNLAEDAVLERLNRCNALLTHATCLVCHAAGCCGCGSLEFLYFPRRCNPVR